MISAIIRRLGVQPYESTLEAMRTFTLERTQETADEIWVLEHPSVFTQGTVGKSEHVLDPHGIPVVQSDRGGQVTYHGLGQIIIYVLLNLRRLDIGVKKLVSILEQSIIDVLADVNIESIAQSDARGVYADEAKIASIGLRVRNGFSYHGLSFDFKMNLTPFSYINPCGYEHLTVTQFSDLKPESKLTQVEMEDRILSALLANLGYNNENF